MRQDRVLERLHVNFIYLGKALKRALLAIEQLQDRHAAHMLLQVGVDPGNRHSDSAVGVTHLVTKNLGRNRN